MEESVGFIQAINDDLRRLHAEQDRQAARLDSFRDLIQSMQLGKMHTLELEQATMKAAIDKALTAIDALRSGQQWLSRLLVGALLTAIIGGSITMIYKLMSSGGG